MRTFVLFPICLAMSIVAVALSPAPCTAGTLTVRKHGDPGALEILDSDKPVLRYNYQLVHQPPGFRDRLKAANAKYAVERSDYIHPLYGLHGEVLTDDWVVDHPHHRGIYWAWPEVDWHGNRGDLHALQHVFARPTGKIRSQQNADFAQIEAENEWQWEDRTPIVREEAVIRVYPRNEFGRPIDLSFRFTVLGDDVQVARRDTTHYGGLNLRLAPVQDQKIVAFTDPAGTRPRRAWAHRSGIPRGGASNTGLTILQNHLNPDDPGDWVQYPNLSWVQPTFPRSGTRFTISKLRPLELRYRLWIHDKKVESDLATKLWDDYNQSKAGPERIPLLVVPLEFSDCKLTLTDEDWNKKIFSTPTREEEDQRFDLFGFSGTSVNNYYSEVTCGRFQFEPLAETCGTANDGVIRVSLDTKHPHEDPGLMYRAVQQAVTKASRYIDFSKYDRDKNKILSQNELVILVVAAGGEEDKFFSKNRHYGGWLNLNGCRARGFIVVTERRDDLKKTYVTLVKAAGVQPKYKAFPVSVGTLIHELGHEFGTPDLLNVGYLTAMGYGQKCSSIACFPGTKLTYQKSTPCHYGAYTMVKAGFVEPVVLEKTGGYTVNSSDTGKYNVYKIPTKDPREYFLIENRQYEGADKALVDKSRLRKNTGLAIWHINETYPAHADKDKHLVVLEEAGRGIPGSSATKKSGSRPPFDPYYHQSGNTEFSDASTPNNRSYGGERQPWKITEVSSSDNVMTFRYSSI